MSFETNNPEKSTVDRLTPAGNARRESIRESLNAEFVRIHIRRRRNRAAIAWSAMVVGLLALGYWRMLPVDGSRSTHSMATRNPPASETVTQPELATVDPATPRLEFELIDDNQLLDMLAEAGHPSALAWIHGKPVVIPLGDQPAL